MNKRDTVERLRRAWVAALDVAVAHRRTALVVALIAPFVGVLAYERFDRERVSSRTAEATHMVYAIAVAQEAYRAETGQYANVSTALALRGRDLHALYPHAGRTPGRYTIPWAAAPCPASACEMPWSDLPVYVDGPPAYGYSTIAGTAETPPPANELFSSNDLSTAGSRDSVWFVVSAVGDPDGRGAFTTVLFRSWSTGLLVDGPDE